MPSGFVELRLPKHLWWVKTEWERVFPAIFGSFCTPSGAFSALPLSGGRGALYHFPLTDGGRAIVRYYRRGGFVRHLVRDVYWDRPFRPLAELTCTEIARQHGVPTVEVLAAGIERVAMGLYRGLFISREAEGFMNFWDWLRGAPPQEERRSGIEAVAQVIAYMHAAGIYHADLNLTNILVQTTVLPPKALLIDFDRAQVFPNPLSPRRRERNLRRLRRSLDKLDPGGRFFSQAEFEIFDHIYRNRLR